MSSKHPLDPGDRGLSRSHYPRAAGLPQNPLECGIFPGGKIPASRRGNEGQKGKDGQKRQLERYLEELKKACNEALAKECREIAAMSPEVLETALPSVLQTNAILRDLYKPNRSPLDNYRKLSARALGPYLKAMPLNVFRPSRTTMRS